MGNLFTKALVVTIDYFAGSITSAIWEWIFPQYSATTGKMKSTFEGLLQLGATALTAPYLLNLLTPASLLGASDSGLVLVMFFAIMYSPNMMAKLQSAHNYAKSVTLFNSAGGFRKKEQSE